jgi:putative ABC transport system permease protein
MQWLKTYDLQRLVFSGFKAFALLTILIGAPGLYGLLSFITVRRTRRLAYVKSLEHQRWIFFLLSKEFLLLIIVSFLATVPISHFLMEKGHLDFAYRADLTWWIFALGFVTTMCIALMTTTYNCLEGALQTR